MTVEQQQQDRQIDELEKIRATARIVTRYIEQRYEDDEALITVMVELGDRLGDCATIVKIRRLQIAPEIA